MTDVSREEFRSLKRQVRTLQRQVEEQQKQIAKLKRRTTTDTGVSSANSSANSKETDSVEVPLSAIELCVLDILKENAADEVPLSVEKIKNQAAESGQLRSEAKIVVKDWLSEGYLIGDLEGTVEVVEWPSETAPLGDQDSEPW